MTTKSNPAKLALADHLTASGAVMYSAYWCPHCHEQKELFGKEAAKALKVVECAPDGQDNQVDLCRSKGLEDFPAGRSTARSIPGLSLSTNSPISVATKALEF